MIRKCNITRLKSQFGFYNANILVYLTILILFVLNQNVTLTNAENNDFMTTNFTQTNSNNTVLSRNLTEFDEYLSTNLFNSTKLVQEARQQVKISSSDILKAFKETTTTSISSTTITTPMTTTTSTTTTTTSTTTTTTTTTTTKALQIAFINDFNISEISYDTSLKTIKLGYLIKANFSSSNDVFSPPILLEIKINCSSVDSNQFWFRSIKGQLVVTTLTYSTTKMAPYYIEPLPGSFINCTATTVDLNQFKTFHSSNYILNKPLPVQNLESNSLNETSINLNWLNPSNNSFNSVELKCNIVNESSSFEMNIHSNTTDKYIVGNLIPGTQYICQVTLIKSANDLIARSDTQTILQMTKLSQAVLIDEEVVKNDLIEFRIKPPEGNYDFFKLQLVNLNNEENENDHVVVRTKVYNNLMHLTQKTDTNLQEIIIFDNNLTENVSLETAKIQPGFIYELWTETAIYTSNKTLSLKRVKLTNDPFIIKPAKISNLLIYALADNKINVTWRNPSSGRYLRFIINVYSLDNLELISTHQTRKNSIPITLGNSTADYIISVVTCAKLHQDCDAKSNTVNKTFSFEARKIFNFSVKNYNANKFLSTSASISMTWNLNLTEAERCDLSRFHIIYTDFNKASSNDCYTKTIRIHSSICSNLESDMVFKECDQFDKLNCFLLNGLINCSFNLNGLNFNTDYNMSVAALSKTGEHEWPVHNSATLHTEISVPSSLRSFQLLTNTQLGTDYMINIIQPYIDESNGAIYESYLYLVCLGGVDEKQLNNETLGLNQTFKIDLIDQAQLVSLLDRPACSNQTGLFEPCLLKKYSHHQNDFRQERPVFIGNLDGLSSVNLTGINYENITSNLIKPMSFYQLFYVFKIRYISLKNNILFAINPSEPIKTHAYNQLTIFNQPVFRDGMALWIVIVISITSSLLLCTIIAALVTLIVIKYKPKSRFRKAAQIVTQPLNGHHGCASRSNIKSTIESSSKTTFNNDYVGMFMNDFVEPGEFSRYDMTNIWLVKHANGDLILDEEYRNLPDYRNLKTSFASQSTRNEIKNRFLDIKAFDDSRVILDVNTYCNGNNNFATLNTKKSDTNSQSSVDKSIISSMSTSTSSNNSNDLDHHLNSDYINANFIQGYSHENKFIATQGPKKETISDFWLMIWQYRVTAIVMLTKLVEKGVERCTQYWPEKLNISEIYGDFEVTMKDQQKCGDYLKRTFELVYLAKPNNLVSITMTPGSTINTNKRPLVVTQYYYPEWPDKDTPSTDPMSILHLIRDVNLNHLKYQYPIVVHCSAGVGRTGTYITLDAMMEKINIESKIDIFGFISKIRERRQYLVQTSKQYVFIHEALYEYCLYGFTDVEASRLISHYKYLNELSPTNALGITYQNSNKTRIQIEFEKINNAFTPNSQAREAFSSENKHRNRYLNTICYDENRIKLSGLNGSTYINATKIKGYEPNNEIIITQDPMFNTVFEFWKMITEYECNIIVCLNKDFEFETESIYWPSEEDPVKSFECEDLKFVIQLITPVKLNSDEFINNQYITKRELEITEYKYGSTSKVTVTQFIYNEIWPEDRAPKNRSAFLDLVGHVQKTAAKNVRSNIAVHAHGGGSNCSVFCTLIYLLEQFKNDQYVDVCRLVKKLKTQRPHMVETFEQYQFLYQCLVDFVDMFGIYSQSSGSFHSRNSLTDSLYRKSPAKDSSDITKPNQIQLNL